MRRRYSRARVPRYRSILLAVAAGLFFAFSLTALLSTALRVVDAAPALLSAMAGVSLSSGCFCAGFCAAKRRRRHGLRLGLLCGLLTYAAIFLAGTLLLHRLAGLPPLSKLLLALLCGAVGGVLGVNTKIKKTPKSLD